MQDMQDDNTRIAQFILHGFLAEGEVMEENNKTVLIKLRRAGTVKLIKRHKTKHCVKVLQE